MSKTFEELKSDVRLWLKQDALRLPDPVPGDLINIAQQEAIKDYDLFEGEKTDTFNTATNTPTYVLPVGFERPITIWFHDPQSGNVIYLTKRSNKAEFDAFWPDPSETGTPQDYLVYGSLLYIGPTPDGVYLMTRNYHGWTDLVDGTPANENLFTQRNWQTLLWGALSRSSAFGIEDERIPLWEGMYQQGVRRMQQSYRRARTPVRAQAQEPA